jgi:outer membrane protein assembly factor BamB
MRTAAAIGVLSAALILARSVVPHADAPATALQPERPAARGPAWTQWGGPDRNFVVAGGPPLAERWPEGGPPVKWTRALGPGHSAILAEDGRLYTMYRRGVGRGRRGPWDREETIVSLDAETGRTIWEYRYPSALQDFDRGAGPHSTPLIVGRRLFAVGTNKELHALDTHTGQVLWSHDLVEDFGAPELLVRPVVKAGYGTSPIAYRDTVITYVGGPGQSVVAFRQSDGAVAWKSGHFLVSGGSPILIELDGQEQLVCFAGALVAGLDPATGRVLWAYPHDAGNDFNFSLPLWSPEERILFISSAYRAGSRALRLTRRAERTDVEELWYNRRLRFQFLNGIRLDGFVYGTTGDFGPAFLSAIDIRTGERAWQQRGFAHATLLHADGKAIVLDEDGHLALVRLSPAGADVLSRTKLFDTVAWTVPTLAGTTLYARDREQIVALELGKGN